MTGSHQMNTYERVSAYNILDAIRRCLLLSEWSRIAQCYQPWERQLRAERWIRASARLEMCLTIREPTRAIVRRMRSEAQA